MPRKNTVKCSTKLKNVLYTADLGIFIINVSVLRETKTCSKRRVENV